MPGRQTMRDPYEVLGVAKNATAKEIKAAYRKLAKKYHPDQNPDDPKAKERFNAATQAYDIVGDEKNRGAFDRGEIDAEGKPRFQGFEGGSRRRSLRRLPPPGAARAGSRFEFRTGGGDRRRHFQRNFRRRPFGGRAGSRRAWAAGRARPPAGADLNATLDVTRRGNRDSRQGQRHVSRRPQARGQAAGLCRGRPDDPPERARASRGRAAPGDALVKIHFRKHPRYRVEGRDLHVDLPVPLADAVLGAKVAVETPTGKVAVNVPPWSSSDKVLRLKGRGLPVKTGGHARSLRACARDAARQA